MSEGELREHGSYLGDAAKVDAFDRALRARVGSSSTVLDLGCGTGLLGLLAARAGARRVFAVDRGDIAGLARELVEDNTLNGVITVLKCSSTEVVLPELVDVVVADQLGGFAVDAGVAEFFADAKARLLKPQGVTIPQALQLYLAPAADPEWEAHAALWDVAPHGLRFSRVKTYAANTCWHRKAEPAWLLGQPAIVAERSACDRSTVAVDVDLPIERPGRLGGLLGMFRADMAPGITLSNIPGAADRMSERWQTFFPLAESVDVEPGDRVRVKLRFSPTEYTAHWQARVTDAAGRDRLVCRQSTLRGKFLASETLQQQIADETTPSGSLVPLVRELLDVLERSEHGTVGQVAEQMAERRGGTGDQAAQLTQLLSQLARLSA